MCDFHAKSDMFSNCDIYLTYSISFVTENIGMGNYA